MHQKIFLQRLVVPIYAKEKIFSVNKYIYFFIFQ